MAKNKKKTLGFDWKIVLLIQVVASATLLISVMRLGMLPTLYLGIVAGILALLCLIFAVTMKPRKKKNSIGKLFAKVVSLLLSILLALGCLYIEKGNSVLDIIAGANKQITRYSLFVLADNEADKLKDLEIDTFNLCQMNDNPAHIQEVLNELNEDASMDYETISNYTELAQSLYDKEVDAILMNEAFIGLLEDTYPKFASDTKSVWHYDIIEDVEDISKEADVTKETFTIYVSGIDTTGPISSVSRSDVNMLITVNPVSKQILMTSIPRDYFVPFANFDYQTSDKLTHAGLAGVENSVKTIENFLDIEINYYAKVNFTSLETIVDALGGITVDSPYAFTSLHGNYWFNQGLNEMDGHKALCFVRERYSLPHGDNDRVYNQQLVIKAMIEKALSPSIITNYTSILDAVSGAIELNMDSKDIMKFIRAQLNDMSGYTFHSQQLSGWGDTRYGGAYYPYEALYYMIPNDDSVEECKQMIKQMTYSSN